MRTRGILAVAIAVLLAAALPACPVEDSGGPGGDAGGDTGGSSDGGVDGNDDGGVNLPPELFGDYDFVSVTLDGTTITTENQDIMGSQVRADGSLSLRDDGTYSRVLRFYADDVLDETEQAEGSWSVDTPGVVTIDEDGDIVDARYTLSSGTLTMTQTTDGSPTMEVDELVYHKRD